MTTLSIHQKAYQATSTQPISRYEIYKPMVDTAVAVGGYSLGIIRLALNKSDYATLGLFALSVVPVAIHGTKLILNWIPKLLWKMPKGEVIRTVTNVPNVRLGLAGWRQDSTHSNHFDEELANAVVGLGQEKKATSHVDFDCGGKGEYSAVIYKAGIPSTGVDFSEASVRANRFLVSGNANLTKQYDLVTSFEVLSKTAPGQEEEFVKKLVEAAKSGGTIVMSCAIPGQAGPNCNHLSNERVIALFKKHGCEYDKDASWKLRRSANPMHIWFKDSIMVFNKA